MEASLGRNNLVGTTIKTEENLPVNLAADEKHTWLLGEKVYIAVTAGNGCILGTEEADSASQESLTAAYGVFKKEVEDVKPGYRPATVNTDGWDATQNSWKSLFPSIAVIACFVHVFIAIRDRSKKRNSRSFFLPLQLCSGVAIKLNQRLLFLKESEGLTNGLLRIKSLL